MKDGRSILGMKVTYNSKNWVIKDVYHVKGNPELYVGLSDGQVMLNVRFKDILNIIEVI